MAELEMQQEPADMMSLNDALALMRVTAAAGGSAKIGPVLLARLVEQIDKLESEVKRLSPTDDEIRYTAEQNWSGLSGAVAWHLADRHGEGWAGIGDMMDAWRDAEVQRVTAGLQAVRDELIDQRDCGDAQNDLLLAELRQVNTDRDALRARLAEIEAQTPIENGAELLDLASRLRKGLPIFGGGYVRIAKALEHLAATNGQRAAQLEAIDEFDAAKRGER